jgi:Family of unknown function (DUF5723)
MKKTLQLSLYSMFCLGQAFAQTQGVAYTAVGKGVATTFVTDYHCLGINASALGWGTGYEGKKVTMGATEFNFGMYSDSLSATKLRSFSKTLANAVLSKSTSGVDFAKQKAAAADYAQAGIAINLNYNWAGFSFQSEKFGGIAFNIRENYQWYSKLNEKTTDIIFRGKFSNYFDSLKVAIPNAITGNIDTTQIANDPNLTPAQLAQVISGTLKVPLQLSTLTRGSRVKMSWTRSYNLGYGRRLAKIGDWLEIYAGVSGRFIQSMALFDLNSDASGLSLLTSLSPSFKIDYGSIASINPSAVASQVKGIPKAVGNGYGVDLSGSVRLWEKLKISVAVNNIGSVNYKRNVYQVNDTLFGSFSLAGLDQTNITKSIGQMLSQGGLLKLIGQEKYVVANAADFRFGSSWKPAKWVEFGFDMVAPLNVNTPGSIQNAVFSFGGEIRPVKWLALSAGFIGGGIYKANIPLGINFILKEGAYEFGVSSGDALSFFSNKSNSVSTAFGFARARF